MFIHVARWVGRDVVRILGIQLCYGQASGRSPIANGHSGQGAIILLISEDGGQGSGTKVVANSRKLVELGHNTVSLSNVART